MSVRARRIVQVGAWAAMSVALASAVHKNAQGRGGLLVVANLDAKSRGATELELARADMQDYVHLREGDARCTLQALDGPFDFVWLSCAAYMASDVLAILDKRLREGALVGGVASASARDDEMMARM